MQKHLAKTLIAVAVASASFAAHAVDVYGNVDAGYTNYKDASGVKVQAITSGVKDPSFIGFKGAENLGGGLKAEFVLESGFDLTNGALAKTNTLFSRNAYVGVSGGFGAIKLGQISSFSQDIVKKYDAFGGELWGAANSQFNTFGDFQSNTVAYSNAIGPIKAGVSHKVAGQPNGGLSDGSVTSIAAGYDQGPVSVGIVYSMDKTDPAKTAKTTQIGGSYAIGFGKAFALYENGKDTLYGSDAKDAYMIGFKAPVTSAASVLISGGHKEAVDGTKHGLIALGGEYSLSKRTAFYASYSKDDVKDAGDSQAFTAGVSHKF